MDCIGGRRFRVLFKGYRDGYNIVNVEFLRDVVVKEKDMEGRL